MRFFAYVCGISLMLGCTSTATHDGAAGSAGTGSGGSGGTAGTSSGGTAGTSSGGAGGTAGSAGAQSCDQNGSCDPGETLADCAHDCGNWGFVDTDLEASKTYFGDAELTEDGTMSTSYSVSLPSSSSGACTNCAYQVDSGGIALDFIGAVAKGGVSSSNELMVATYDAARQIVLMRQGPTVGTVANATYAVFGILSDGSSATQRFGLRAQVQFDTKGCLMSPASGILIDGLGADQSLTITGTGSGSGCLEVADAATGAVEIPVEMNSTPARLKGWLSPSANVILLVRGIDDSAGQFQTGTILLVKRGSGMGTANASGSYYVSHLYLLAGQPGSVRGSIQSAGNGTVTGGSLFAYPGSMQLGVQNGTYTVSDDGRLHAALPIQGQSTQYTGGQLQPAEGTSPVIVSHSVAPGSPSFDLPPSGPSLMVLVR